MRAGTVVRPLSLVLTLAIFSLFPLTVATAGTPVPSAGGTTSQTATPVISGQSNLVTILGNQNGRLGGGCSDYGSYNWDYCGYWSIVLHSGDQVEVSGTDLGQEVYTNIVAPGGGELTSGDCWQKPVQFTAKVGGTFIIENGISSGNVNGDTFTFTVTAKHQALSYIPKAVHASRGRVLTLVAAVRFADQTPIPTSDALVATLYARYSSPTYAPAQWHKWATSKVVNGRAVFRFGVPNVPFAKVKLVATANGAGFAEGVGYTGEAYIR